jgi:hypothetical protein
MNMDYLHDVNFSSAVRGVKPGAARVNWYLSKRAENSPRISLPQVLQLHFAQERTHRAMKIGET